MQQQAVHTQYLKLKMGEQIILLPLIFEETAENREKLKEAFVSKTPEEIVAVMHQLKSSAKSVGARRLAEDAERLEFAARAADLKEIAHLEKGFLALLDKTMAAVKTYLNKKTA